MLYKKGRYSVDVGRDGSIKVKPGDWLSKYSAAMFNTFWRTDEFGRMTASGLQPVADPNRITAGEMLYHIPTYVAQRRPGSPGPSGYQAPQVPPSVKKDRIIKSLQHDYHVSGNQLHILGKAIDIVGYSDNVLSLLEIVGLEVVFAPGVAIAAGILSPIGNVLTLLEVNETDTRIVAMVAEAYVVTAWTFDDPIPSLPASVRQNVRGSYQAGELPRYQEVWDKASQVVVSKLNAAASKAGASKKSLQVLYRAATDDNRQSLCRTLLNGFDGISKSEKDVLAGYAYPN